jgi:hypothetical protein
MTTDLDKIVLMQEGDKLRDPLKTPVTWSKILRNIKSQMGNLFPNQMLDERIVYDWLPFDFIDQVADRVGPTTLNYSSSNASYQYGQWRARIQFAVETTNRIIGVYELLIFSDGVEEASYEGIHPTAQQRVRLSARRPLPAEISSSNGTTSKYKLTRRDTWRDIALLSSAEYIPKRPLETYVKH